MRISEFNIHRIKYTVKELSAIEPDSRVGVPYTRFLDRLDKVIAEGYLGIRVGEIDLIIFFTRMGL